MSVGFIGLGIMGKPMARNLLKAGYALVAYDVVATALEQVVASGAKPARSPREVAEQCDVVVTMLPNSPEVRTAVLGKDGVVEGIRPGSILVDMSSIAPLASKEIAAELAKRGVAMVDAPVSGGEPKAVDGTLAIMVGGKVEDFERVKPLLLKMGSSAVRCGEVGAGNVTKLANQVIVALNIAAMSEAYVLAAKAGVDPGMVFEAIRGGLAGSTVLNAKSPMVLEGNYKPGFRIELHVKDLQNALDTAHGVGSPIPLTSVVMEILQALKVEGKGKNDHSGIIEFYERLAGVKVRRQGA